MDFDFGRDFGRLEGKMDELLKAVAPLKSDVESLKKWRAFLAGGFAVVSGLVAILFELSK